MNKISRYLQRVADAKAGVSKSAKKADRKQMSKSKKGRAC